MSASELPQFLTRPGSRCAGSRDDELLDCVQDLEKLASVGFHSGGLFGMSCELPTECARFGGGEKSPTSFHWPRHAEYVSVRSLRTSLPKRFLPD